MKKILPFFLAACICLVQTRAQQIASFNIKLDKINNLVGVPMSINLDELSHVADSALALYEVQGNKQVPIPFQIRQEDIVPCIG